MACLLSEMFEIHVNTIRYYNKYISKYYLQKISYFSFFGEVGGWSGGQ